MKKKEETGTEKQKTTAQVSSLHRYNTYQQCAQITKKQEEIHLRHLQPHKRFSQSCFNQQLLEMFYSKNKSRKARTSFLTFAATWPGPGSTPNVGYLWELGRIEGISVRVWTRSTLHYQRDFSEHRGCDLSLINKLLKHKLNISGKYARTSQFNVQRSR